MKRVFIYSPHWSTDSGPDMDRCRASVPDGGRMVTSHQCGVKSNLQPYEQDGETFLLCRRHHPDVETKGQRRQRVESAIKRCRDDLKWLKRSQDSEIATIARNCVETGVPMDDVLTKLVRAHDDARAEITAKMAKLQLEQQEDDQ